jgi:hypothetical protein
LSVEVQDAKRGFELEYPCALRGIAPCRKVMKKGANFRACVNEKTRCGSIQAMKFFGSSDEIHSP